MVYSADLTFCIIVSDNCWNGCAPVYDASTPDVTRMEHQHVHRLFIDVVGVRLKFPLMHSVPSDISVLHRHPNHPLRAETMPP